MFLRVTLLLALFLASCVNKATDQNFKEKFGTQVDQMKSSRSSGKGRIISVKSSMPSRSEVLSAKGDYHPYIGITKFGEKPERVHVKNREIYEVRRAISSAGLAPDVFDLNYNLAVHPPFRRIGIEFDNIGIPRVDSYGVETAIAAKTYIAPNSKVLQKTIDLIIKDKSEGDVKNSLALVREKKGISRKRKMEKIFGSYKEMKIGSEKE